MNDNGPVPQLDPHRLIQEWQQPIYHLAYRMIGNAADAADVTQEIFLRVLKQRRTYDPARPLRPWLFAIAINTTRNALRSRARRTARERKHGDERADAESRTRPSNSSPVEDTVAQRELEQRLLDALDGLDEESRELVVLHYLNGLSQTEVASVLRVPRTTVRSRLQRALDRLRFDLAGCGFSVALPALEGTLRTLPAPTVQAGLSQSLHALAGSFATTTTKAGAAAAVAGGLLMTQKMILGGTLVAALALTAGYWLGSQSEPNSGRAAQPRAGSELAKLRSENQALRDLIAAHAPGGAHHGAAGGTKHGPIDPHGADASKPEEGDAADTATGVIDWASFSKSLAKNRVAFEQMHQRDGTLSLSDRAKAMKVIVDWASVLRQARELSDRPIYDEEILTGLVDAIFWQSLELDENQRESLRDRTSDALRTALKRYKVDSPYPLQAYGAREQIVRSILSSVRDMLTPEQIETFEAMERTAAHLLESDREVTTIGLQPGVEVDAMVNEIAATWKKAYRLTDAERDSTKPLAREFLTRAEAMLKDRGLFEEGKQPANAESEFKLDEAMLTMQIEIEDRFLRSLGSDRLKAIASDLPRIFRVRYGRGVNVSVRRGPGF